MSNERPTENIKGQLYCPPDRYELVELYIALRANMESGSFSLRLITKVYELGRALQPFFDVEAKAKGGADWRTEASRVVAEKDSYVLLNKEQALDITRRYQGLQNYIKAQGDKFRVKGTVGLSLLRLISYIEERLYPELEEFTRRK